MFCLVFFGTAVCLALSNSVTLAEGGAEEEEGRAVETELAHWFWPHLLCIEVAIELEQQRQLCQVCLRQYSFSQKPGRVREVS